MSLKHSGVDVSVLAREKKKNNTHKLVELRWIYQPLFVMQTHKVILDCPRLPFAESIRLQWACVWVVVRSLPLDVAQASFSETYISDGVTNAAVRASGNSAKCINNTKTQLTSLLHSANLVPLFADIRTRTESSLGGLFRTVITPRPLIISVTYLYC